MTKSIGNRLKISSCLVQLGCMLVSAQVRNEPFRQPGLESRLAVGRADRNCRPGLVAGPHEDESFSAVTNGFSDDLNQCRVPDSDSPRASCFSSGLVLRQDDFASFGVNVLDFSLAEFARSSSSQPERPEDRDEIRPAELHDCLCVVDRWNEFAFSAHRLGYLFCDRVLEIFLLNRPFLKLLPCDHIAADRVGGLKSTVRPFTGRVQNGQDLRSCELGQLATRELPQQEYEALFVKRDSGTSTAHGSIGQKRGNSFLEQQ